MKIEIIDLSHKITKDTPKYKEDPETKIKTEDIEDYKITTLTIGTHTGTHIDAPQHYIQTGETIEKKPLKELIGNCNILKTKTKNKEIKIKDIENLPEKFEKIVIIQTNWSKNWGEEKYFIDHPYPSKELIKYLIKQDISTIGIDTPSIDSPEKSTNHNILLKNKIYIIENLTNLKEIKKDKCEVYFIPLKIKTEASPIRAFVKK